MGTGIAYVSAVTGGMPTVIVDRSADQLRSSESFISKLLSKAAAKGRIDEAGVDKAKSLITYQTDLKALSASDFVVEAATEDPEVKFTIFRELDQVVESRSAILASNTSSISITKLAAQVASRPESVIGMHFMNPVPVMKLVEVISGLQTSAATLTSTLELSATLGKTTTVSSDAPGFIVNRLLMPYINEAIMALQEGVGSVEDIDTSMKLGTNVPMGPLQLADFIGLDTCLAIMNVLHQGFGDSKYRPANLLVNYVNAGWLGKKSGRGFHKY